MAWWTKQLGFNVWDEDLALGLADLGAKCRGLRHEETIRRQKEGLAELRERIKLLEKAQAATFASQGLEPLVVLKRDLPEKTAQRAGVAKEHLPLPMPQGSSSKFPSSFPSEFLPGAAAEPANVAVSDALDLSEKMYLDLIRALGALMNMKELTGMQSVRHLPQEERENMGLQRQKDLQLLYNKICKLKSRLERKEEMLKDYESSAEQLRLDQVSLHACREEVTKLEDEVYKEAEENALLKEALERTQVQLNQEKRLNRAVKLRQSLIEDKEKRSKKELPGCAHSQKGRVGKAHLGSQIRVGRLYPTCPIAWSRNAVFALVPECLKKQDLEPDWPDVLAGNYKGELLDNKSD
ncbi:PREDICTED: forkhead-associated domain-containing protein 1-like [Tinamus guttatus]|uniref:forkhead-associated domain-containing protein 1-like n=1 Tax=Tinamus guttatus TaxID=94827 RepID=UPI00052EB3A0|nr:PREDICTED: forkhead-associated domain-containing protein 1-like [Tinamus guttatus]